MGFFLKWHIEKELLGPLVKKNHPVSKVQYYHMYENEQNSAFEPASASHPNAPRPPRTSIEAQSQATWPSLRHPIKYML